jgi:hypothetical protein
MADPTFLQLEVTAVEDLHTGTGTGSGDIDAHVARDRHGRPVIRATHIKGLLRQAGEELIGKGAQLDGLLGTNGGKRGAVQMTSLRFAHAKRVASVLWASTAREPNTRVPKRETLRIVEHVPAGTKFRAILRLAPSGDRALLERLVYRVDRLGGDRSRGSGLVCSEINDAPRPEPLELTEAGDARRLNLVLRNFEPLCLPITGHPGNLIPSQSFIRGQALRGALAAWALARGRDPMLAGVSVGDALPLPHGITSASELIPVPLSLMAKKPDGGEANLPWWAQSGTSADRFDDLALGRTAGEEKPKRPGAHEYLCRLGDDAAWWCYAPEMSVHLRNQTADDPEKQDTELFSTEEIAEDTYFQAELRFRDGVQVRSFLEVYKPVLTGVDWIAVGRGGQPVAVAVPVAFLPEPPAFVSLGETWTLTLTSDLIARGRDLGFCDDLSIAMLAEWAGMTPKRAKITRVFAETERLHGFNAATGLPRVPALAIRRGSCWRVEGDVGSELGSKLLEVAVLGLGERSDEGCGRFAVGLQPIARVKRHPGGQHAPKENREETLRALAEKLAKPIAGSASMPSRSQLHDLRARAQAAADAEQLSRQLAFFQNRQQLKGGAAWQAFPFGELAAELEGLNEPDEKRDLVVFVVDALASKANQERRP